jgi:uncharacterized protein YkwD
MKLIYGLILCAVLGIACVSNTSGEVTNPPSSESTTVVVPSSFTEEMLREVNQYRSKGCRCGPKRMPAVPPLKWNDQLKQVASAHAKDMQKNNFFDHKGSDGSSVAKRATVAGYKWSYIGENIAWGPPDIRSVVTGWIESPGHCKNIMSRDYKEIGAARNLDYWVQVFGTQ